MSRPTKQELADKVSEVATQARSFIHESLSDLPPAAKLLMVGRVMQVLFINHYHLVLSAGEKAQAEAELKASQAQPEPQPETTPVDSPQHE